MECPQCKGEGYREEVSTGDYTLTLVRVWCEHCQGSGVLKYYGDRSGIEWEGE